MDPLHFEKLELCFVVYTKYKLNGLLKKQNNFSALHIFLSQ